MGKMTRGKMAGGNVQGDFGREISTVSPYKVTYYSVWVAHAFLDQTSTNGHGLLLSVGCSCYFGSNQYKWT